MSILQTTDLKKYYGTGPNITRALDGVTFPVEEGEFVAVVGTSGSGKSTLLNMMGGLDIPTSGSVRVRDQELANMDEERLTIFRRRNIGFIFHNYNLSPILNVYENIVLPVELDGDTADKKFMEVVISMLGLTDKLYNMLNNLSGGQQQRRRAWASATHQQRTASDYRHDRPQRQHCPACRPDHPHRGRPYCRKGVITAMTLAFENDTRKVIRRLARRSMQADRRRSLFIILTISLAVCLMGMLGFIQSARKMQTREDIQGHYQAGRIGTLEEIRQLANTGKFEKWGYTVDGPRIRYGDSNLSLAFVDPGMIDLMKSGQITGAYPQMDTELCIERDFLEHFELPAEPAQTIKLDLGHGEFPTAGVPDSQAYSPPADAAPAGAHELFPQPQEGFRNLSVP